MRHTRTLSLFAATIVAVAALAPAAHARHHRHHHVHAAKAPVLVPAHQRPDYVGVAGAPVPGLIDVGFGPVFPFGGWPAK